VHGSRCPGGQYKRHKDCLKSTVNCCGVAPSELEALTMDRADWHSSCKSAVEKFEIRRIQELESKWDLRKSSPPPTSNFECQICHRMCRSRISLLAHNKSHSWWWDPSRRRLSPWLCTLCNVLRTDKTQLMWMVPYRARRRPDIIWKKSSEDNQTGLHITFWKFNGSQRMVKISKKKLHQ